MEIKHIAFLILAVFAGWSLGSQRVSAPAPEVIDNTTATANIGTDDMPLAEDYVSLRPLVAELPKQALDIEERNGLLLMREEEKLARDVYLTLYDKWNVRIFSNIAQSEETHTEAVRSLLTKYQINDPVKDNSVGVFTNPTFSKLYTELVATGSSSLVAAYAVGATIEDLDINDLENLLAATDNQDITTVYKNLQRGSRNHLRSFTNQLSRQGVIYTPKYISQSAFIEITGSDRERVNP